MRGYARTLSPMRIMVAIYLTIAAMWAAGKGTPTNVRRHPE